MIPVRQVLPDSATGKGQRERGVWSLRGVWTSDSEQEREGSREVPALWVCCVLLFDIAAICGPKLQDTHPQLTHRDALATAIDTYTGIYRCPQLSKGIEVSAYLSICWLLSPRVL